MDYLLIFSAIVSSISEIFPELGYSYFQGRDLDKNFYTEKLFERLIIVLIVWLPISFKLYKIDKIKTFFGVLFIMRAFYMRINPNNHTKDSISGFIYGIGFIIIGFIIIKKSKVKSWKHQLKTFIQPLKRDLETLKRH